MSTVTDSAVGSSAHDHLHPIDDTQVAWAEFAADLCTRLRSEVSGDGGGRDDQYLLGYAQAMADVSAALLAGECAPGGLYYPSPAA